MSSPPLMAAFAGRRLARDSDSDETADETVDEDDDNDDVALEAEGWDLLADAPAGGSGDTGSEQSVLGYGAHSIVRLLPDRQRVVKSVGFADCSPQAAGELRRLVATETAILQQLHAHHPNMVKLHGVVEDATRVGIVMDRAPGKDLAQWVVAAGGPWAEDKTRMVVQQLVSVLQYIHVRHVCLYLHAPVPKRGSFYRQWGLCTATSSSKTSCGTTRRPRSSSLTLGARGRWPTRSS